MCVNWGNPVGARSPIKGSLLLAWLFIQATFQGTTVSSHSFPLQLGQITCKRQEMPRHLKHSLIKQIRWLARLKRRRPNKGHAFQLGSTLVIHHIEQSRHPQFYCFHQRIHETHIFFNMYPAQWCGLKNLQPMLMCYSGT